MLKYLASLLFLTPISCLGQFTIWGKVFSITDKKPVENANVFITNTTSGAHTKADGSFRLDGVKNGNYELVVSIVGYATFRQAFVVNDSDFTFKNIQLLPKTIELNEVKIKPDENRKRNYEWFKSFFLGTSENASQCKILNPDIVYLDYDDSTRRLTGSSNDFIEIENNALGYNLKYLLNNFLWDRNKNMMAYDGAVLFENMEGTESQKKKWTKNRQNAYLGSSRHFFKSVIGNSVTENGFWIHQLVVTENMRRPADSVIQYNLKKFQKLADKNIKWLDSLTDWEERSQQPKVKRTYGDSVLKLTDVIKITDQKNLYAFDCDGDNLYIIYAKKNRKGVPGFGDDDLVDSKATVISFNSSRLFFDNNGWILNPNGASFSGFWATKRMADLLPIDYEPPAR